MNARVVGVFVCVLLVGTALAADPAAADPKPDGEAPAPDAGAGDAPANPAPSKPDVKPVVKPTIRPQVYPIGSISRHIHPPRIGLDHDKFRNDVQYLGGGVAPTPEQAFARSRQLDPRVSADVKGPDRKQYTTPHYAPEQAWDLFKHQQSRRQRLVPVDLRVRPRRNPLRLGGFPRPKFERELARRRRAGRGGRRGGRRLGRSRRAGGGRRRQQPQQPQRSASPLRKPRGISAFDAKLIGLTVKDSDLIEKPVVAAPRRRGGNSRGRSRARRATDAAPGDEDIWAHVVYDAPFPSPGVRIIPRKPMDGRVEAHVKSSAPRRHRRHRHTVHAHEVHTAPAEGQTVIVGDIKQWVDKQLSDIAARKRR